MLQKHSRLRTHSIRHMRPLNTTPPPPGPCSLNALPDPYQLAFRQGSAHHLPGQFLPVEIEWFIQILMLPFCILYALPPISLALFLLNQLVQNPQSYSRFFAQVMAMSPGQIAFTVGLIVIAAALLVYCAWFAWGQGSAFGRTWQAHQQQRRKEHGFGMVLLERGLVARLIDNVEGWGNCLWIPREAIANIVWQQVREEGAKHSRWVFRTQVIYLTEHRGKPQKRWLTLRGSLVKTGYMAGDSRGDRALFDTLYAWWQEKASQTEDCR